MFDEDEQVTEKDLIRWSEALSAIARTGLAFTESLYEQERFQEVMEVAAEPLPFKDILEESLRRRLC